MAKKQQSVWERDITHEMLSTLAVFGLVVSSLVAGLGVATLGVQAQVAFAQREGSVNLTAAAFLGDDRQAPPRAAMANNASNTPPEASRPAAAAVPMPYCPKIAKTIAFGRNEATSTGDVGELQRFIASRYGLPASTTVSGYFGSTTAMYLERFQKEQGIPTAPTVGPLTRAAIAKACLGAAGGEHPMATTTPLMGEERRVPLQGTTTPPMPPRSDMHPTDMMSTSTRPQEMPRRMTPPPAGRHESSMRAGGNAANAAAVVGALSQIGEGYQNLLHASISLIGL